MARVNLFSILLTELTPSASGGTTRYGEAEPRNSVQKIRLLRSALNSIISEHFINHIPPKIAASSQHPRALGQPPRKARLRRLDANGVVAILACETSRRRCDALHRNAENDGKNG